MAHEGEILAAAAGLAAGESGHVHSTLPQQLGHIVHRILGEGVNNIDSILSAADAVMVARGDLGVEIDFTELPGIQKSVIDRSFSFGKPIVTATQMLDSMMVNPRPTRAEISDVANAIYDGTSAIMLSGRIPC